MNPPTFHYRPILRASCVNQYHVCLEHPYYHDVSVERVLPRRFKLFQLLVIFARRLIASVLLHYSTVSG